MFSQGKTVDELEINIRDAFQMMVEEEESAPSGAHTKEVVIDV